MALKRMSTEEMVTITSTWVDQAHPDRQAMAQEPALAALLPQVDTAHHGLHVTHVTGPSSVRIKQIQDLQKELDVDHDDELRGIWSYLWALVYFARTTDERTVYLRFLRLLLPDGLAAVKKSYREEAGQAALAASRLTDGDRQALGTMALPGGRTLLDAVNQWLSLGAQLGALDRERAGEHTGDGPTPADALIARNQWIRTVQTVCEVGALVAAENPVIQQIIARVEAAGRVADRRAGIGSPPDEPSLPDDEQPVPGTGLPVPSPDTP